MTRFIDFKDPDGNTAIMLSIKNIFKYSKELTENLNNNIDQINFQDSNGINCLMMFSIYNFSEDFIKYLIIKNVNTSSVDKFNRTALSYASISSHKDFLKEYFDNYQEDNYLKKIWKSLKSLESSITIFCMLFDHGANLDIKNNEDENVYSVISNNKNSFVFKFISYILNKVDKEFNKNIQFNNNQKNEDTLDYQDETNVDDNDEDDKEYTIYI